MTIYLQRDLFLLRRNQRAHTRRSDEVFQAKNPAKASKLVVHMRATRIVDEKGLEAVTLDR